LFGSFISTYICMTQVLVCWSSNYRKKKREKLA
jgi:hypothetical protein